MRHPYDEWDPSDVTSVEEVTWLEPLLRKPLLASYIRVAAHSKIRPNAVDQTRT